MDSATFDWLTRLVAGSTSRRRLGAGFLGTFAALLGSRRTEALAPCPPGKKRCPRRCIPQQRCCTRADCGQGTGRGCRAGRKPCRGRPTCVPETKCCVDSDCRAVRGGTTQCRNGRCVTICRPGFGNCNRRQADGCETNLNTNVRHCGRCGNACPQLGHTRCLGGRCAEVFDQVGSEFFTAPAAGTIAAIVSGAQGGQGGDGSDGMTGQGGAGGPGGLGARVLASFAVAAGERLRISVGGIGQDGVDAGVGGGNGGNGGSDEGVGGNGGNGGAPGSGGGGGGGGGMSDVREAPFQLLGRILLAGGGGGGGGGAGGPGPGFGAGGRGGNGGGVPDGGTGGPPGDTAGEAGAPGGVGSGFGPPNRELQEGVQTGNGQVVLFFTPA